MTSVTAWELLSSYWNRSEHVNMGWGCFDLEQLMLACERTNNYTTADDTCTVQAGEV